MAAILAAPDPNGKSPIGKPPSGPQDTPESVPLPADAAILLPVRNTVLFPGIVAPITIGRPKSIAAVQQAVREERPIGRDATRCRGCRARSERSVPDRHGRNIVRYMTAP